MILEQAARWGPAAALVQLDWLYGQEATLMHLSIDGHSLAPEQLAEGVALCTCVRLDVDVGDCLSKASG